jgi:hypothetical protein
MGARFCELLYTGNFILRVNDKSKKITPSLVANFMKLFSFMQKVQDSWFYLSDYAF